MKKQFILLIIVTVAMSFQIWAQTFIADSDTVYVNGYANEVEIVAKNNITNDARATIDLNWKRVVNDIGNWEGSQVCDNVLCYQITQDQNPSNAPFTIDENDSGNLDVHFRPDGNEGEGIVRLHLWDVDDSTNSNTTLTYIAKAELPVSINDKKNFAKEIKIYPNPARDFLYLKDLPSNVSVNVEVYNILGRKMLSESLSASKNNDEHRIDLNELQKGIYLVRIFDDQMNILATHSISKVK